MSFDDLFLDRLAEALQRVKLDAVLIGNAASVMHGAPVLTQDADILIRDTRSNRQKLAKLVVVLGGTMTNIDDLAQAKRIHLTEISVDVLFDKMSGNLTFNAVRSRATRVLVGQNTLVVATLEDVIRSKEAAGRKKDLAVLPILRDTLAVERASKLE